eukprot:Partr_v1_DN28433_c2_g1_i2_m41704 putative RNA 3-terminal phosphate
MKENILEFEGHRWLRHRLCLSILSGRTVRFSNIRPDGDHVGLKDHEISFIDLVEKITNGSAVSINYTGTGLLFKPGVISGGPIEHDCGVDRAIGYYIEGILPLCPFAKVPVAALMRGITNDNVDASIDMLRTGILPFLERFGVEGASLKIQRRGAPPLGGGSVKFVCPVVRALTPFQLVDAGRVRKIRGIAYSAKVSPQICNRMVSSAKSLLNHFIPDVYIYTDSFSGVDAGLSAGFGLSLVCDSTTNTAVCAELMAAGGETPEDIGLRAAKMLYAAVAGRGCVDAYQQPLCFILMALCPEDVSKVHVGSVSDAGAQVLRDIHACIGVKFKIVEADGGASVLLSCMGSGYLNYNKKTT